MKMILNLILISSLIVIVSCNKNNITNSIEDSLGKIILESNPSRASIYI